MSCSVILWLYGREKLKGPKCNWADNQDKKSSISRYLLRRNIHLHSFCLYRERAWSLQVFSDPFDACLCVCHGTEQKGWWKWPLLVTDFLCWFWPLETFCKTKTNSLDHAHEGNYAGAMWECLKPWVELKCCILLKALVLAGDAGLNICRIFHSSLLFPVSRRTYTVDNSSCFLTVHLLIKQWTTYIINNKFVQGFLSNLSKYIWNKRATVWICSVNMQQIETLI